MKFDSVILAVLDLLHRDRHGESSMIIFVIVRFERFERANAVPLLIE